MILEDTKINVDASLHNKVNDVNSISNNVIIVKNKDFIKVKWNSNYVIVTYTHESETITCPLSQYFTDFKDYDKKPKITKYEVMKVVENIKCLLKHYNMIVKFNMFKASYEIFIDNKVYKLEDYLVNIQDKCTKHNFKIAKDRLIDSLIYISKENQYNPVKDYLIESYNYYLSNPDLTIFKQISDTIQSDSKLKDKYIGRFLLQMIYIACSEEDSQTSSQYLLVLQGKQGIGKTTWLQNLLPQKLKSKYFLGGRVLDLTNKDHIMETITNWLCEIGEISSTFRKSDQEALKNFITAFKDKFRLPYAKESIEQKRRTTLCGTTNDTEYLKDLTGTRRFLTLHCIDIDFNHNIDLDMLWGYMYSLYLKNKPYWFTNNEIDEVIEENNEFLSKPESILIIEEKFNLFPLDIDNDANEEAGQWMKASEIYDILKPFIPDSRAGNQLNKFTIGKELKKLNMKIKYDKKHHTNLFYVKRL